MKVNCNFWLFLHTRRKLREWTDVTLKLATLLNFHSIYHCFFQVQKAVTHSTDHLLQGQKTFLNMSLFSSPQYMLHKNTCQERRKTWRERYDSERMDAHYTLNNCNLHFLSSGSPYSIHYCQEPLWRHAPLFLYIRVCHPCYQWLICNIRNSPICSCHHVMPYDSFCTDVHISYMVSGFMLH